MLYNYNDKSKAGKIKTFCVDSGLLIIAECLIISAFTLGFDGYVIVPFILISMLFSLGLFLVLRDNQKRLGKTINSLGDVIDKTIDNRL